MGQLAAVAGTKRFPTIVGFALTAVAIWQSIAGGGASGPWWAAGALAAFLVAVVWAYHDLRVENERLVDAATRGDDRWERLEEQLRRARSARAWLMQQDDQERSMPGPEDRVLIWAKETYDLLLARFPAEADDFMGKDADMGEAFFSADYIFERGGGGRAAYLEKRIAIVRRILRARTNALAR